MRHIATRSAIVAILLLTHTLYGQSTLVPGAVTGQPVLFHAPAQANPGDPVVVTFLNSVGVDQVILRADDGVVAGSARAFRVATASSVSIGCAVLGLASTLTPGTYELELLAQTGEVIAERSLVIDYRDFRREEIALSSTLTVLRATEDPAKTIEALQLQAIVAEFNSEAVYHLGSFLWPYELTRRTSLFGDRRTYLYADGAKAQSIHTGLDLASPTGSPVASSGAGVVRIATSRIVTGNTVVIEHLPGVYSLYYHLNDLAVREGDVVGAGGRIGTVGSTGLATGPHLHWEFRIGGVPVDPERVLPGLLVDFDG